MIDTSLQHRERARIEALAIERRAEARKNAKRLNMVMFPVLSVAMCFVVGFTAYALMKAPQNKTLIQKDVTK